MSSDPKLVNEIFSRIIKLHPSKQTAALERECGSDAELRQRVSALLQVNQESSHYPDRTGQNSPNITSPVARDAAVTSEHTPDPGATQDSHLPPTATANVHSGLGPGMQIGARYTLREKIGEGGMGEVWVAMQSEPVKRKVAIKLIKTGMDSKSVLARFEQERQALALMDHPNIAKVLDGGMTPSGQPFFVMELVNGLPLNKFCDDAKLSPKDRLELFVPICQAVQHAHQKGIVHRDLKPANILVTIIDGKPVPKVIDFGVAKATSGKITDESMATQFGAVVGTLEYMSPEQAGFSGEDIDTRSDIYSLGVILYELLTGLRPIDIKRLQKAALNEMIRIIREEEPSKPSTRLSTDESLPSLAALRQTEPKKLMAMLRGELDWVVLKCLEKQRERRYETANALARDIQRYLADEPVEARPASTGYRLRKLLSRNKGAVLAAGLVLLTLVIGLVGTSIGLVRAQRAESLARKRAIEANAAREATDAANAALAESFQRETARFDLARKAIGIFHGEISEDLLLKESKFKELRTRLLQGAADFYDELKDLLQPQSDAHSQRNLSLAYLDLGELTSEIGNKSRALEVQQKSLGIAIALSLLPTASAEDKVNVVRCYSKVGELQKELGDFPAAEKSFQKGIDLGEESNVTGAKTVEMLSGLGTLYLQMGGLVGPNGQVDRSLKLYVKAKETLDPVAANSPDSLHALSELAFAHNNIGAILSDTGDPKTALESYGKALAIRRKLVDKYPTNKKLQQQLAQSYGNIAQAQMLIGSTQEQLNALDQAKKIQQTLVDENPAVTEFRIDLARSFDSIGYVELTQGKLNEAFNSFSKAATIQEVIVQDNPDVVEFRGHLARFYNNTGAALRTDMAAALVQFQKALAVQQGIVDRFPTLTRYQSELAQSFQNVGLVMRFQGNHVGAIEHYEKAIEVLQRVAEANPAVTMYQTDIAKNYQNMAVVMNIDRQWDSALQQLAKAIKIQERLVEQNPNNGAFSRELARSFNTSAEANVQLQQFEAALADYRRSKEIHERLVKDFPDILDYRNGLAYCLSGLGRTQRKAGDAAGAAENLSAAIEQREKMSSLSAGAQFDMASNYGTMALLARDPATEISPEDAERFLTSSIERLKSAVEAGYRDLDGLAEDEDFSLLRENPDFQKLLENH